MKGRNVRPIPKILGAVIIIITFPSFCLNTDNLCPYKSRINVRAVLDWIALYRFTCTVITCCYDQKGRGSNPERQRFLPRPSQWLRPHMQLFVFSCASAEVLVTLAAVKPTPSWMFGTGAVSVCLENTLMLAVVDFVLWDVPGATLMCFELWHLCLRSRKRLHANDCSVLLTGPKHSWVSMATHGGCRREARLIHWPEKPGGDEIITLTLFITIPLPWLLRSWPLSSACFGSISIDPSSLIARKLDAIIENKNIS